MKKIQGVTSGWLNYLSNFLCALGIKNLTLDVSHMCKKLSCKKTCLIEFLKSHFDIFCVYADKII
jgi:hypothetical protein